MVSKLISVRPSASTLRRPSCSFRSTITTAYVTVKLASLAAVTALISTWSGRAAIKTVKLGSVSVTVEVKVKFKRATLKSKDTAEALHINDAQADGFILAKQGLRVGRIRHWPPEG